MRKARNVLMKVDVSFLLKEHRMLVILCDKWDWVDTMIFLQYTNSVRGRVILIGCLTICWGCSMKKSVIHNAWGGMLSDKIIITRWDSFINAHSRVSQIDMSSYKHTRKRRHLILTISFITGQVTKRMRFLIVLTSNRGC